MSTAEHPAGNFEAFSSEVPQEGHSAPTEVFEGGEFPGGPDSETTENTIDNPEPGEEAAQPAPGDDPGQGYEANTEEPKSEGDEAASESLKAYLGDDEVELKPELSVPVKVNGEEQFATLEALRENYSGKVAWDKKFSEVDRKAKEVEQREALINKNLGAVNARLANWAKQIEGGDPKGFIDNALELMGQQPQVFWNKVLEDIAPQAAEYLELSEAERERLLSRDELTATQEKLRKLEAERAAEKQQLKQAQEVQLQINQILQQSGVTQEEAFAEQDAVARMLEAGQLPASVVEQLKVASQPQIAKYLADRVKLGREVRKVKEILSELDPALAEDEKAIKHLFGMRQAGGTDEELRTAASFYRPKASPQEPQKTGEPSEVVTDIEPTEEDRKRYESQDFSKMTFDDM